MELKATGVFPAYVTAKGAGGKITLPLGNPLESVEKLWMQKKQFTV